MPYQFFNVSSTGEGADSLNGFLGNHRVMSVTKEFLASGTDACWCFCVEFLIAGEHENKAQRANRTGKIDYKEILEPVQFTLFAKLRDARKIAADKEGVPAYAIFTNEQLAEMVRQKVQTQAEMSQIQGVGKSRIERYSAAMLEILKNNKDGDSTNNEAMED